MGIKKIIVCHKRSSCIGCGSCAFLAPKNWKMNDDDGRADLVGGVLKGDNVVATIDETDYENNKKAEDACPMNIIKL